MPTLTQFAQAFDEEKKKEMKRDEERFRKYFYMRKPEVKERIRLYMRYRRKNNLKQMIYDKEHSKYKYRREYFKNYVRKRKQTNIPYRIAYLIRLRIRDAMKKYINQGIIVKPKKSKINYYKIIEHLKPFPENIKLYHIDHIIPLSSFNLTNPIEFEMAFAPENHQWLTAQENLRKSNKLKGG